MNSLPTQDPRLLRRLRLTAGLTQQQLADRAECSKQQVSAVERGATNFSPPARLRVELALGLKAGELLVEEPDDAVTAP